MHLRADLTFQIYLSSIREGEKGVFAVSIGLCVASVPLA